MPPPCSIRLLSKYIACQFIPLIIRVRSKRSRYRTDVLFALFKTTKVPIQTYIRRNTQQGLVI